MEDTVMTFTENDLETIKTKGGDYDWSLNKNRAGKCKYLFVVTPKVRKKGLRF
jgi:hypothetical protein